MSYIYKISSGNPEGYDFFFTLIHENEYSQEDFTTLVENLLAECYEEHYKEWGFSYLDCEKLMEKLVANGFRSQRTEWTACYDLEPYWNKERIQSSRLRVAIDMEDKMLIDAKKEEDNNGTHDA
jgi:site-specific DNA-adenine methylase